jgi:hypothetical protein
MNVVDYLLSDHNAGATMEALGEAGVTGSQPHPLAAAFNAVHRPNPPGLQRGYSRGPERGGRYPHRRY